MSKYTYEYFIKICDNAYPDYNMDFFELKKALKKAQKQEKLLELYKTRIELQEIYNTSDNTIKSLQALDCIREIDFEIKQLKEIENE